jgi:hypothetical protein
MTVDVAVVPAGAGVYSCVEYVCVNVDAHKKCYKQPKK